ncbi:uncharacterized protein AMSG_06736 [Thecamonas trahens ATCC 50062]|uniref:Ribosome-binding factor A n=1 Tax=Thecamonas trahens ATCC 50062 TaxID=461836 RepID=A0A0L0DHQ4_THETB|nr:hypothetical protein AMSG_06736 [Thecamonas trahens ATCC 50062]KNC50833.1 hypothetical protein AMSG_06736 [Thecamonas trahens ATCC 50062]|eukprot:XP_013756788.1 hypothetical protein AMSG_06736 [Thecamonas trahens ATCC 50062]
MARRKTRKIALKSKKLRAKALLSAEEAAHLAGESPEWAEIIAPSASGRKGGQDGHLAGARFRAKWADTRGGHGDHDSAADRQKKSAVRHAPRDGVPLSNRQIVFMHHMQRRLSALLGDGSVKDADLRDARVDVLDVEVTRDRRRARVLWDYAPDPGADDAPSRETVETALLRAAPYIRSLLSESLTTRHVPELVFVHDTRPAEEDEVDALAAAGLPTDLAAELTTAMPTLESLLADDEDASQAADMAHAMAADPWIACAC